MIEEVYVSFKVAKLLKEKGFDERCRCFYKCWPINPKLYNCDLTQKFDYCTNSSLSKYNYIGEEMNIAAPTHQMAMTWLREVHNINIDIESIWNQKQFEYQVFIVTPENAKHCYIDNKLYLTYKEAVEAGLKYALENLI